VYLTCYMKKPINPTEAIPGTSGFGFNQVSGSLSRSGSTQVSYNDTVGYGPSTSKRIP
jgi:hypothetical protein